MAPVLNWAVEQLQFVAKIKNENKHMHVPVAGLFFIFYELAAPEGRWLGWHTSEDVWLHAAAFPTLDPACYLKQE